MINIEDTPEKSRNLLLSPVFSCFKIKRKLDEQIETKQFYQTKLNFKIQKNKMNVCSIPVSAKKSWDSAEIGKVKDNVKRNEIKLNKVVSKRQKNRAYIKVDYTSKINKGKYFKHFFFQTKP